MAKPRPTMDSLPFSTKPSVTPTSVESPAEPREKPEKKVDERVTLIIRVSADDRRTLKTLAAQQDTTIQEMMDAAIQDIIRRSR